VRVRNNFAHRLRLAARWQQPRPKSRARSRPSTSKGPCRPFPVGKEPGKRGDNDFAACRLGQNFTPRPGTCQGRRIRIAGMKGQRNGSLQQDLSDREYGFATQPHVQQCRRKRTVGRVPKGSSECCRRSDNSSAGIGQRFREIERDDGLVLDDKNSGSGKRTIRHWAPPLRPTLMRRKGSRWRSSTVLTRPAGSKSRRIVAPGRPRSIRWLPNPLFGGLLTGRPPFSCWRNRRNWLSSRPDSELLVAITKV